MNKKIIKQFFPEALRAIQNERCPICNKKINMKDFRDNLSLKEFQISKMCQKCQDEVFK